MNRCAIVVAAFLLVGCVDNSDFRRNLEDGFPAGIGVDGDMVTNLRGAMAQYHMEDQDIDCMVDEVFKGSSPVSTFVTRHWSADELNAFAAECGVNLARLWYMTD